MSAEFGHGQLSTSAPVRRAFAPFSVILYDGLTHGDEHVTVWEPRSGKTVAGNAAPYRKNLQSWLNQHPGWEEKSDELKSSKRRTVARRQKAVSAAFAALCFHAGELPRVILNDACFWLRAAGAPEEANQEVEWTTEEDSRLKESVVQLAEEIYFSTGDRTFNSEYHWKRISSSFVPRWTEADVLRRARDLLKIGLQSYGNDSRTMQSTSSAYGSPMDPGGVPASSPMSSSLSFMERHLVAPREPRITVWEPATGRTVSGNAAPCRRNLEAWIKAHPGWEPKSEEQLTSSRRVKGKRPHTGSAEGNVTPASTPQLSDALDALMLLSRTADGAQEVGRRPTSATFMSGRSLVTQFSAISSTADARMETGSASSDMEVDDGESDDETNEEISHPPMMKASSPVEIPN